MQALRILAIVLAAPAAANGQSLRLVEVMPPGAQVHVDCQVTIEGSLNLPAQKGQAAKTLPVSGSARIEYDERILKENDQKQVEGTVRAYSKLDFARRLGAEEQKSSLRPAVSRLVILRHKQYEVPFCPTAPLTIAEIELVRTDVFTPALRGLLPAQAVQVGATWRADLEAVRELTDLETIDSGGVTCRLEEITRLVNRRVARVSFAGNVSGIREDGKAQHQIDGSLYFDLDSSHIAYVSIKGTHLMPGSDGRAQGKIEGSFTLTREPRPSSAALDDAALRGLILESNDDNTRLLFDDPLLGRFLYPLHWHVVGTNPRQVGLDDSRGSGLWIVIDPGPPRKDAVEQFHQAVQQGLGQQKANLRRVGKPEFVQAGLTSFTIDAVIGGQEVTMRYYVVQQPAATATVTATIAARNPAAARDVERIVRSIALGR